MRRSCSASRRRASKRSYSVTRAELERFESCPISWLLRGGKAMLVRKQNRSKGAAVRAAREGFFQSWLLEHK